MARNIYESERLPDPPTLPRAFGRQKPLSTVNNLKQMPPNPSVENTKTQLDMTEVWQIKKAYIAPDPLVSR